MKTLNVVEVTDASDNIVSAYMDYGVHCDLYDGLMTGTVVFTNDGEAASYLLSLPAAAVDASEREWAQRILGKS